MSYYLNCHEINCLKHTLSKKVKIKNNLKDKEISLMYNR